MIRTGVAAAGTATVLALVPGSASAAFDTGHDAACENVTTIAGVGASFQRSAQLAWGAQILAPDPEPGSPFNTGFGYAASGCGVFKTAADGGTQRVTYEPRGSGDARNAFGATGGVRNTNFAFGGVDEPHTAAQLAVANAGPSAGTEDDAVLHTIPVAQSAVAVNVQLPTGCTVAQTPTARRISRAAVAGRSRRTPRTTRGARSCRRSPARAARPSSSSAWCGWTARARRRRSSGT